MRALLCCLLLGVSLSGQYLSSSKLASILMALSDAGISQADFKQQVVDEMFSVADGMRMPSRAAVTISLMN